VRTFFSFVFPATPSLVAERQCVLKKGTYVPPLCAFYFVLIKKNPKKPKPFFRRPCFIAFLGVSLHEEFKNTASIISSAKKSCFWVLGSGLSKRKKGVVR